MVDPDAIVQIHQFDESQIERKKIQKRNSLGFQEENFSQTNSQS